MNRFKRIFVLVADSLGIGALEDAHKYNDEGANTLKHLSYSKKDFSIPTLEQLGLGKLTDVNNTKDIQNPLASYGKAGELSVGKDTLTGHFEIMGLRVDTPFPSFTDTGFPDELIQELSSKTGHRFIGNIAASGTEILKDLGEEHLTSQALILYTSSDSVLQIAANEEIIPLEELYRVCQIAREITLNNKDWMVGRIIARPFVGKSKDTFTRTSNRHDYAVKPFAKTTMDYLKEAGLEVYAIGKIRDIFDGEGITKAHKTKSNSDGMEKTIAATQEDFTGLCFINLVDFDALFGHRRDAVGYATSLEEFDAQLSELLTHLTDQDLLIITADHGNDPLHEGTDHTREYVPILAYSHTYQGVDLGTRKSFADIAATIAENFSVQSPMIGTSFLQDLHKK